MELDEIVDLLAAVSPILSAAIAFITAKYTARNEFRKQELQWKREDQILENRDFSKMVAAVSQFAQSGWSKHQREAMEMISVAQSNLPDLPLDSLYHAVASGDREEATACLQDAINARNSKSAERVCKFHKKHRR